jgi:hypothetical protein
MAELTYEELWRVCQRKPGDYEPYGKRKRLKRLKGTVILGDCAGGLQVVPHPERTRLTGLGRLRQSPESSRRAPHIRASPGAARRTIRATTGAGASSPAAGRLS